MKERLGYLDAAKGAGILLVVFGHTLIGPLRESNLLAMDIYQGIYFFHMSLFFLISGLLFERNAFRYKAEGWKKFLGKKAGQLLVPYLFISIFFYGGLGIAGRVPGLLAAARAIGAEGTLRFTDMAVSILTTQGHIVRHLWFLYVMFLVMTISFGLGELGKTKFFIFLVLGLFCVWSAKPDVPILLLYVFRYLFFFQMGRLYYSKLPQIVDNRKKMTAALCIFAVLVVLYVRFFSGAYPFLFINRVVDRVTCALLIAGGGCAVSQALIYLSAGLEKRGKARGLERLGRNSFDIYILHQPLIVTGLATVLYKGNVPAMFMILAALCAGVALPLCLSRFVIHRSRVLTALVLGGRN